MLGYFCLTVTCLLLQSTGQSLRSYTQSFSWPFLRMCWGIVCIGARFRFQYQLSRRIILLQYLLIFYWSKCISHPPYFERKNILEVKQHLQLGKTAWETKICPPFLHSCGKKEKQGHLKIKRYKCHFLIKDSYNLM